jgi:hypothetical protein
MSRNGKGGKHVLRNQAFARHTDTGGEAPNEFAAQLCPDACS